jgi:hypothetical protein
VPDWLSQRNHAANRDTAAVDCWHELQVADPTFVLERLGAECTDLQSLRELTVNGLDAINAQGPVAGRWVVWDLDWLRFDDSGGRVRKLSITDTGTGMTPEQLRQYINQRASSGRELSASGNFGVGAKIAAGSRNPLGLEYRSCHRGRGALVRFKRHPDGRWGLEPQRWPDGHSHFWRPLDEHDKPWLLRDLDHGPRSCSSASTSATTPPNPRRALQRPASNGSLVTSTAVSGDSPSTWRCSSASRSATDSQDGFSTSRANSTTSSSARLRPAPCG